jgi:hypothetical protein
MIIIIVLKLNPRVNLGQSPSHWSRPGSQVELTQVNVKIIVVIIIILKLDSKVNPGEGSGHKWG